MITMMKVQEMQAAPVVALHSSASNSSQWKGLIADLGDRHDVFAYDLPVYGTESTRDDVLPGMAAIAQPIIDKIAKLGEPVHLVGHSFGGAVAIKVALMRTDLVKSLTLFEPAAFNILRHGNDADALLLKGLQFVREALTSSIAWGRPDCGMKAFIDFWTRTGAWESLPEDRRAKLASLADTVALDFSNMFAEPLSLNDLAKLKMPVLMLMGMESPAVSQRTSALIVEHAPCTELAMLPGLGHMAPVVAPQWVNPRIKQHIARIDRSATHVGWPQKSAA